MPRPPLSLTRIVLLAVAAEGLLTLMDAIIKALSARYPTLQIAFLRFGFGLIGAAIYTAWNRPGWPTREATLYNGMRALLIVVVATTFFFALARLPLADAIALSFISPVLTAVFGVLLLGERLDWRIVVALAGGFAGMLLIVCGGLGSAGMSGDVLIGVAAVLISAVGYAFNIVLLRHRATRDPLSQIVLFQNLGPAVILALPALWVWTAPTLVRLCAVRAARHAGRDRPHHAGARVRPRRGGAPGAGRLRDARVGHPVRLPVLCRSARPRHARRRGPHRARHAHLAAAVILSRFLRKVRMSHGGCVALAERSLPLPRSHCPTTLRP